jgi:hypothetical protein
MLAGLKTKHLEAIMKLIDNAAYWYQEDALFNFVKNFGVDQKLMRDLFGELLAQKQSNNR